MPDFTSALYLGLRHAATALRPWPRFTTGRPAALEVAPVVTAVARELATLVGVESAVLATSTLHAFFDLFDLEAGPGTSVLIDRGSYPIARSAARIALVRGASVQSFPGADPHALATLIARTGKRRPLVVTDGTCRCGRPAPLRAYLSAVRAAGGLLVIDDTQALGILGTRAGDGFGRGGGGSLRFQQVEGDEIVVISSLAKAFGAPLAMIGGSAAAIARFARLAPLRVHGSPPSLAACHAAEHALAVNARHGDALRATLEHLLGRFVTGLRALGLPVRSHRSPLVFTDIGDDPRVAVRRLASDGIRALALAGCCERRGGVGFLVTAAHRPADIDATLAALARRRPARAVPAEIEVNA